MTLALAIKARIPLIGVQTTDPLFFPDFIQHLTGKTPCSYKNGQKDIKSGMVYIYTGDSHLVSPEETYHRFNSASSVLLVNNQKHPVLFETGPVLLTPVYICTLLDNLAPGMSEELLPVLSGCTEKEIQDILSLTEARDGALTVQGVQSTRLVCAPPRQGLELVQGGLQGYVPDPRIRALATAQKKFFLGDYDYRLRPRGLLATGPSGTGKTQAARYLAKEWGVPLYRLSAGVQDKWVGGSEANLSAALSQIESMNGCVFLLDEVEKFFGHQNDHGVMQQMLGSLLWWMQEHRSRVFTYMTCNSVQIPPELYRPGRIDQLIEFQELVKASTKTSRYISGIVNSYTLTKTTKTQVLTAMQTAMYEYTHRCISHAALNELVKTEIRKALK